MGAWGAGSFDNDTALDWISEFEQDGVSAISVVFEEMRAAGAAGYIDVDVGSMVIAACEVVAASHGHPLTSNVDIPDEDTGQTLADFLVSHQSAVLSDADLPARCVAALDKVAAQDGTSELQALWAEADLDAWQAGLSDLRRRLMEAHQ